jgi:hypothetical protein
MGEEKDHYGGYATETLQATGFFRLERNDDRWRLIDPDGHPFFIVGINHIDDASLKYDHNITIWRERYGSKTNWIQQGVVGPLREWGFNTISWTKEWVTPEFRHSLEWTPDEFRLAEMPYIPHLDMLSIEAWNRQAEYVDVFHPAFEEWCDYQARHWCAPLADDPYLVGYALCARPAWVRHRYAKHWFSGQDVSSPEVQAKLREIIRRYYRTAHEAIRRYDKNHLILGDLIAGFDHAPEPFDPPDAAFEEMGDYIDVLSINWYHPFEVMRHTVSEWHIKSGGKPVYLSDSAFDAPTELKPEPWENIRVGGQRERGEAFARFIRQIAETGYILGWGWCAYIENLARRRGLRTRFDEPYQECTGVITCFNAELYNNIGWA